MAMFVNHFRSFSWLVLKNKAYTIRIVPHCVRCFCLNHAPAFSAGAQSIIGIRSNLDIGNGAVCLGLSAFQANRAFNHKFRIVTFLGKAGNFMGTVEPFQGHILGINSIDSIVRIEQVRMGGNNTEVAFIGICHQVQFLFCTFPDVGGVGQQLFGEPSLVDGVHPQVARMGTAQLCFIQHGINVIQGGFCFAAKVYHVIPFHLHVGACIGRFNLFGSNGINSAFHGAVDVEGGGGLYVHIVRNVSFQTGRQGIRHKEDEVAGGQFMIFGGGAQAGGSNGYRQRGGVQEIRNTASFSRYGGRAFYSGFIGYQSIFNIFGMGQESVLFLTDEFILFGVDFFGFPLHVGYPTGILENLDVVGQASQAADFFRLVIFLFKMGVLDGRAQGLGDPAKFRFLCICVSRQAGQERSGSRVNVGNNRGKIFRITKCFKG
nr:MAG TPA: hypothetical protein [Caudoviricetes sp.]